MAWIESHSSLDKHHKVIRLRLAMRWSKNETIGFLHRFWWTVLEVSPSGDITALSSPEVMAEMLDMPVEAVAKALRIMEDSDPKVAFLERKGGRLLVHDWLDYAGRYLADSKYRRTPDKYEEIKLIHALPVDPPTVLRQSADSRRIVGDTLPTLPNQPNTPPGGGDPADGELVRRLQRVNAVGGFQSQVVMDLDLWQKDYPGVDIARQLQKFLTHIASMPELPEDLAPIFSNICSKEKVHRQMLETGLKDAKKKAPQKHAFEDSPFYPFEKFREALPNWSEGKCRDFWEKALLYSQSKGEKYLSWVAAVRNWDRMDQDRNPRKQQAVVSMQPEFRV